MTDLIFPGEGLCHLLEPLSGDLHCLFRRQVAVRVAQVLLFEKKKDLSLLFLFYLKKQNEAKATCLGLRAESRAPKMCFTSAE